MIGTGIMLAGVLMFSGCDNGEKNDVDVLASIESNTKIMVTTEMTTEEATTQVMTTEQVTTEEITTEEPKIGVGKTIVIDAGHQSINTNETEPLGPGSSEMKAKTAAGTTGVSSGEPEYVLNLEISLKLQEELEQRGYTVVMVRTEHDVNISNVERAQIANDINADAFIRIHANGSEDSSVTGAMTLCQTPNNPYNGQYYEVSRALSDCILQEFVAITGAKDRGVWETDTMTGINWANVPVTIVEMGFMSNVAEDELMQTEEYQEKMVLGIANGVDAFILRDKEATPQE